MNAGGYGRDAPASTGGGLKVEELRGLSASAPECMVGRDEFGGVRASMAIADLLGERREATVRNSAYTPVDPSLVPAVSGLLDIILLNAAHFVWRAILYDHPLPPQPVLTAALISVVYLSCAHLWSAYSLTALVRVLRIVPAVGLAATLTTVLQVLLMASPLTSAEAAILGCLSFVFLMFGRLVGRLALLNLPAVGLARRNVVVFGEPSEVDRIKRWFNRTNPAFHAFCATAQHDNGAVLLSKECGTLKNSRVLSSGDFFEALRICDIDTVVLSSKDYASASQSPIIEALRDYPLTVMTFIEREDDAIESGAAHRYVSGLPLIEIQPKPIFGWGAVAKSWTDYILAGLALLILMPLFALISVAIKIESNGPVFFRQIRLGYNNEPFYIIKFRSMHHNQGPETVVKQATRNDPRVTRVGRFLRASSLDEIPQFINVLNGTMSIVGPRPHALSHNLEYGEHIPRYFARHKVKPGITGWAQVNGLRGETETVELMEARVRHDIYYAENWSFLFDVQIMIKTALVVLFQRTAY